MLDFPEHHRFPDAVAPEKGRQLVQVGRAEPGEGVRLPLEAGRGRAAQARDRAEQAAFFRFRQDGPGQFARPGDQA